MCFSLSLFLSLIHSLFLSADLLKRKKREDKIGFGGLAVFDKANVAVTKKERKKTYKINTCHFPRPQIT